MSLSCVVCGTAFSRAEGEDDRWWCSPACHGELVLRATAREELLGALEEEREDDEEGAGPTEAERARMSLGHRHRDPSSVAIRQERLVAASELVRVAAGLSLPGDAAPILDLARALLGVVLEEG